MQEVPWDEGRTGIQMNSQQQNLVKDGSVHVHKLGFGFSAGHLQCVQIVQKDKKMAVSCS